jgi:hypothetical protein
MTAKLRFHPVSHSWVALHPNPKGVIQFIGGAFFGTFFPMFFYRSLLQRLFDEEYTIVLLPFNFSFDHYAESGFLIREQYDIMPELVRRAIFEGYNYTEICDCSKKFDPNHYTKLGYQILTKEIEKIIDVIKNDNF